jgi:hypothetical protein
MSYINGSVTGWQGIGGGLLPNLGNITGGGGLGTSNVMDNLAAGNQYPTAPQTEGVWYGTNTKAGTSSTGTSLGNNAGAPGAASVAIGGSSTATEGALANATGGIAIGGSNVAGSDGAVVSEVRGIAIGCGGFSIGAAGALASGNNSIAIGSGGDSSPGAVASAEKAIAIGGGSVSNGISGTALGDGVTNTVANQTTIGNLSTESIRLLDPTTTGNFAWNLKKVTLAGATPTPTIAQLLGGSITCSNAGAYTLTMTNVTGTLLDAAAALQPVYTGMSFECEIISSGAGGGCTLGAAAGVTIAGTNTGIVGISLIIRYTRTGANAWEARILGTLGSTGVAAGNYGNATNVAAFTVDSQGRLSTAANTPITATVSSVTLTNGLESSPNPIVTTGSIGWIGFLQQEVIVVYARATDSGVFGAALNIIAQMFATFGAGTWLALATTAAVTYSESAGTFTINNAGVYAVTIQMTMVGNGDFALYQGGSIVPGTTCGGAGFMDGATVILKLAAADVLSVRTLATGIQTIGGGSYPSGCAVRIYRLG